MLLCSKRITRCPTKTQISSGSSFFHVAFMDAHKAVEYCHGVLTPITATPCWRQCKGFSLASQYVPPPWIKIPSWILPSALFLGLSNSESKLGTWSPSHTLSIGIDPQSTPNSIFCILNTVLESASWRLNFCQQENYESWTYSIVFNSWYIFFINSQRF